MADGIHYPSDILIRVNGVVKMSLFFGGGYSVLSLTNGGNKSVLYDRTSPVFT